MATIAGACREEQLLLLCARTERSAAQRRQVRTLLAQGGIDWERVRQLAYLHRVAPLLYRSLQEQDEEGVPKDLMDELRQFYKKLALRNLFQIKELLQVVKKLETRGIPVISFKGPVLSSVVYGHHALRRFGDLDILVPQSDLPGAKDLLQQLGFRSYYDADDALHEEAALVKEEKSYEFVRGSTIVELHWDFLHPMHGFSLDTANIWDRTRSAELGGATVRTLSAEDRVLYLCAHGSKHFWTRLFWICDVAESLRVYREQFNWQALLDQAQALHVKRMLFLGLTLAADLLDAPIPRDVRQAAREDAAVDQLARRVSRRLFQEQQPRSEAEQDSDNILFHLKMRERFRDRIPYYLYLTKMAVRPSSEDKALVKLPDGLSFLYYLLRPIRLLWARFSKS